MVVGYSFTVYLLQLVYTLEGDRTITTPLNRNEVKLKLSVRCKGYLRPVSGNVRQLRS